MEHLTGKDLMKKGYSRSGAFNALRRAKNALGIKQMGKITPKQFWCFEQYGCVVSCGRECKN